MAKIVQIIHWQRANPFHYFLLAVLAVGWVQGQAQQSSAKELSELSLAIWKCKTDSARLLANRQFIAAFYPLLSDSNLPPAALDSIAGITQTHLDGYPMQIFTWNVPLKSGASHYEGFVRSRIGERWNVMPMKHRGFQASVPDNAQLPADQWYGALYYKVIQVKNDPNGGYTLLGWDGGDASMNRKMIDYLTLTPEGPLFGKPIFKTAEGLKSRVVYTFSEKTNMSLRYEYQAIKKLKGKKVKLKPAWMIVADRLIAPDPSMEGMKKSYVASGDTWDGFLFDQGYWKLVEDIEARNPEKAQTMPNGKREKDIKN